MRAVQRLLAVALPTLVACNALVGFGELEKVTSVRADAADDDDDDDDDSPGDPTKDSGGATPDAPPTGPRCDPAKPFEAPVALAGPVNSAAFELAPTLMKNELTLVFQRTVGSDGGSALMATRASVDEPFGEPVELTVLAQGLDAVQQPAMSVDGLVVFFVGLAGPNSAIYTASRASTTGAFGNRRAFVEVNSNASESFPGLTPDAAEMWLSIQPLSSAQRHLFRSVRDQIGGYGPAVAVSELASARSEAGVAFSADGLTIFFGSERDGGKGDSDIWTASRATVTASFGPATPVAELNTASGEYPGWVSPDGCRLYFASERQGDGDLFVATRGR
ncbi:MAG: PD40 domain-containing protein [Labilithrix sp.]|nr:PD40 domain-containing protein [Labilithrix sp.]